MGAIMHCHYVNKFSTSVDAIEHVAVNDNLSKTDLRLFLFLCSRLESRHCSRIDLDQIADTLNIPKKKLKESIDSLIRERIIIHDSDAHVKNGYRFVYTEDFDDSDIDD